MNGRTRFSLGALAALSATYAITACGGDDSSVVVVLADPTLAITALQPVGGPRWEPGSGSCVEVGRDPKQTIALLAASNFSLRPSGTCGSLSQCGSVRVRLDPSGDTEALRVDSSSSTVEIPFETVALGTHTFRLELLDKNGNNVIDKMEDSSTYKSALVTEVTLDVTAAGDCGGNAGDAGDAGSDASEEDASDAGSDAPDDVTEAGDDASDASDASDDASDSGEAGPSDASPDAPKDAPTG